MKKLKPKHPTVRYHTSMDSTQPVIGNIEFQPVGILLSGPASFFS